MIEACIAAKTNYLDFADGADFVFGVARFDAAAKAAGVFVLSGVSSFPVLTAAVLRDIAQHMDIEAVEGGIAPSPYAGIGLNVMRAVVGYAGEPVKLMRDGKMTQAKGLAESRRFTIAPPGQLPLCNIRFSLVDVPDLQVLPPLHPQMRDIWMGAGPVPESLHRALNLLAKARAALPLPALTPLAGVFYRVLNLMKFGEHRGGMYVQARGQKDGRAVDMTWHLLAEGDDGPLIPSMAVEALVRRCLRDQAPAVGARAATDALELADYDPLFAPREIYTGFRQTPAQKDPLYRAILGTVFDTLPAPIRALHDDDQTRVWSGHAEIRRGSGVFGRLIARFFRFPKAGNRVPVSVTLAPFGDKEVWTRNFGGQEFSSTQSLGTGRNRHLIVERFGPISVALALVVSGERLTLVPRRWSVLGLPMPKFLMPGGESFETLRNGNFAFDVEMSAPIVGLIVAYKGTLDPISHKPEKQSKPTR